MKGEKQKNTEEFGKEIEELGKQIEERNYHILDLERDAKLYKDTITSLHEEQQYWIEERAQLED